MADEFHRGRRATGLAGRSGAGARGGAVGNWVEVAAPIEPASVDTRAEIVALVAGAKDGEFDVFLV
jgi:hypothetical protein